MGQIINILTRIGDVCTMKIWTFFWRKYETLDDSGSCSLLWRLSEVPRQICYIRRGVFIPHIISIYFVFFNKCLLRVGFLFAIVFFFDIFQYIPRYLSASRQGSMVWNATRISKGILATWWRHLIQKAIRYKFPGGAITRSEVAPPELVWGIENSIFSPVAQWVKANDFALTGTMRHSRI